VLLVYPSQLFCPAPHWYPIVVRTQLVKLYSFLRSQGIDARILDLELELGRPEDEIEVEGFLEGARRLIGAETYDLVGISCYTSVNYTSTLAIAALLREVQPGARIAVGGYHCLGKPSDFADCGDIDHVVRGDGIQFLDAWLSGASLPKFLSFDGHAPDPNPMLYGDYPYRYRSTASIANIQVSRGCPFPCRFCSEPFIGNSRFTPLPVDEAIRSIDEVIAALDPDKIVIEDLLFGFNAKWRYSFLEALRDRKHRQLFWVEMRADTVTERTVELLSQMNFELTIGLESASPHTIRVMEKARHPERYIEGFFTTARLVQKFEVPTNFSVMLNYPGETFESFTETMDNIERAQRHESDPHFRFDFFEYSFYPGNHVFEEIDDLEARFGTRMADRAWYTRRDGRMLEMALSEVPSRALLERVGLDRVHDYFDERTARVHARTSATGHLRCQLVRSWRFVCALQRRLPELRRENFFARRLAEGTRRRAASIAALSGAHAVVMHRLIESVGRPSWLTRHRIWSRLVDRFAEQISTPDALEDASRVKAVVRDAEALLAQPSKAIARLATRPKGRPWKAYL
jgi:radical SAM superfamily enzyme YgiQ (UPF0313 family)